MRRSLSPPLAIIILNKGAKRGVEILGRIKILGQTKNQERYDEKGIDC